MLPVSGADELVASGAMRMAWPMISAMTAYSRLVKPAVISGYWTLLAQSIQSPCFLALTLSSSMILGYDFQRSFGSVETCSWKSFSAGMHSFCGRAIG